GETRGRTGSALRASCCSYEWVRMHPPQTPACSHQFAGTLHRPGHLGEGDGAAVVWKRSDEHTSALHRPGHLGGRDGARLLDDLLTVYPPGALLPGHDGLPPHLHEHLIAALFAARRILVQRFLQRAPLDPLTLPLAYRAV